MEDDEFEWHRENYTRLQGRYEKLVGNAQEFDRTVTARKQGQKREQVAETLKVLSDPEKGIPGWNDEVYSGILEYGVSEGLEQDDVSQITNASVIKLLYKAQQYDKLQAEKAQKRQVVAEKIAAAPNRLRKSSGRPAPSGNTKQQRQLEAKLASGRASDTDAMAALMGRWGVRER
jgi:hypothetical protein